MFKIYSLIKSRLILFGLGTITGVLSGLSTARVIDHIKEGLKDVNQIDSGFITSVISFSLLAALFGVASTYFLAKITAIIIRNLTQSLSEKVLKARFEYVEAMSERIVPILTREVRTISRFINDTPQFIIAMTTVISTLIGMFITNWRLTLFFSIVFVLQAVITAVVLPYLRRNAKENVTYNNLVFSDLSDLVYGIKELSLNKARRKNYISSVISNDLKKMNDSQLKRKVVISLSDRFSDLTIFIFTGLFLYFSVNGLNLNFEEFKTLLPIVLFLIPFTSKITGFFKKINTAEIALEEIYSLGIDIDKQKVSSKKSISLSNDNTTPLISFKDITFEYSTNDSKHENNLKFGPLNLEVQRNKIIFIVGGNGSGKTTFSKILTGLYTPCGGNILLQGSTKIDEENLIAYRDLFSAYYTDSHIFKYLDHVSDEDLSKNAEDYISLLEMSNKIEIIDKEFSTTKLSYGQRCRLALIANLLDDKEIYLFDEWAANQDPYFKSIFYYKILPFLKEKGKTVIVISHDEKYFDVGDEIIELQEGMKRE